MPLILVENIVVMFNPCGSKDNAPKKVPYFKPRFVFLLDVVAKQAVLPIKFLKQVLAFATKLKVDM